MMRQDHNASLWTSPLPRRRQLLRCVAFGAIGAVVTVIAGMSLVEQVTPLSASTACVQAWPYLDAGCSRDASPMGATTVRPIRVIGLDRTAPVVVTKAPSESSAPAVPAAMAIAAAPVEVREPAVRPVPSTDGAGRVTTVEQPPPPILLSDEELTFKAGALHRSGMAVAAKADAAVKPPAPAPKNTRAAKSQRTAPQTYELPDGRRVTVHRGYRDEDADDRRLRAAEAGRRYGGSFGAIDGERRGSWGLGGLY
jgi:hypothetical protein